MRENIQKIGPNSQYIHSSATLIAEEPDKSTTSYVGAFNPEHDIGSSSWQDWICIVYHLENLENRH